MTDDVEPVLPAATGPTGAESSLPHRFGANVFSNYVALVVTAVSAIVVTPLLLHHLGRPAFGVWVLASTVVAYLELFELGFGGASTKLVAEDAHVRPEQAVRMINTTFFVLVPMGVIALGVGIGIAFVFPGAVHVAAGLHHQVVICVAILAVGLAVSIPGDTFGGSLMGHQRFDLLSLSNASMGIAISVASVVIVVLGGGIVPLAIATTIISVSFQGVRWALVRRIIPGARIRPRLVDRLRLRAAANISGWFLLSAVLQATLQACDVVIVGIVLGVRPAAVYAVGAKLAKAANQSMDSLAIVFFPYASATVRNEEPGGLKDIVIDGVRVTLLVGDAAGPAPHHPGRPRHPGLGGPRLRHLGPRARHPGPRRGAGLARAEPGPGPPGVGQDEGGLRRLGRGSRDQLHPVGDPGPRHRTGGRGRRHPRGGPARPAPGDPRHRDESGQRRHRRAWCAAPSSPTSSPPPPVPRCCWPGARSRGTRSSGPS